MRTIILRNLVTALVLACCGGVALVQGETRSIEFNSLNAKQGYPAIVEGRAQYSDKIKAVFTRPNNAQGDVPVIVIMHGSGGTGEYSTEHWSKFFLDQGIATFVVDSFGPRGIQSSGNDQSVLSYAGSSVDALVALKTVAAIPDVDISKIGVIGFSRGAVATVVSGYENIRAAVIGKDSKLQFALHVALYGGCGSQVGTTTGKPMLLLMGDDDDYVSPKTCTELSDIMRGKGANIDLVVYPGAKHGFDQDRKVAYLPQAQTIKSGPGQYIDLDNLTYFVAGKQVSSKEYGEVYGKSLTRGVSFGGEYKAAADAHARIKTFVRKNFAM